MLNYVLLYELCALCGKSQLKLLKVMQDEISISHSLIFEK
jgi:hypothetical protein